MLKLLAIDIRAGIDADTSAPFGGNPGLFAREWLEEAHVNPLAPTARILFQGALASLATVTETFPECADHIRWITLGSDRWRTEVGDTYGATAKEITRIMPSFEETLSAHQIAQVAAFERSRYGGLDPEEVLDQCSA